MTPAPLTLSDLTICHGRRPAVHHLSGSFAPAWFPLQVFRFFSTINFLLCLPVGISLAYVAQLYLEKRSRWNPQANASEARFGRQIIFTHTEVPFELQGKGVGSRLARGSLDLARERRLEVVPLFAQRAKPTCKVEVFRFCLVKRVCFSKLLIERFASEPQPALLLERNGFILIFD